MLFDIALPGETDSAGVITHIPIAPAKPLKPFVLKLPSLSFEGQTMNCELCKDYQAKVTPDFILIPFFFRFTKLGTLSTKCCYRCKVGLPLVCQIEFKVTVYVDHRSCTTCGIVTSANQCTAHFN